VSATNWDCIHDLVTVLLPMEEFVKLHSGREYPTLNEVIPSILILRSRISRYSFGNTINAPQFSGFQLSQFGMQWIRTDESRRLVFETNALIDETFRAEMSCPMTLAVMCLDPRYRDLTKAFVNAEPSKWTTEEAELRRELARLGQSMDFTKLLNDTILNLWCKLFPTRHEADRQECQTIDILRLPIWTELQHYHGYFVEPFCHKAYSADEFCGNEMVMLQFLRLRDVQRAVFSVVSSSISVETIWSKMNRIATKFRGSLLADRAGKQAFVGLFTKEMERAEAAGCPFPTPATLE
jgi:hypothetical protein